jgi:hypothetical protein
LSYLAGLVKSLNARNIRFLKLLSANK